MSAQAAHPEPRREGEPFRRFALPVIAGLLLLFVGLVVLKIYEDGLRSRERGRLVTSIVDQQFRQLSSGSGVAFPFGNIRDDSADLRRWLVMESFKPDETPRDLALKVQRILLGHGQAFSPVLRASLSRWASSLMSWNHNMGEKLSGNELLNDARQAYFEATGYQKIGRSYDATALQLQLVAELTRFVDRDPFDPGIPEALFMLGVAYLNLGHALPQQMRRDRILNLCGELYPDSLWARRSDTVWREVFIGEI